MNKFQNSVPELALPQWEGRLLPIGIEPYSGGKDSSRKVKVWLEDGSMLLLYRTEIRRWNIRENTPLEGSSYTGLMQALCRRARAKSLSLLKDRDRTEQDMRTRLLQYAYPDGVIEDAIAYLYYYHYLDDERYLSQYLFQNRERKSTRQIVQELRRKGLSEERIRQALEREEAENPEENKEAAAARRLYEKYCRRRTVETFSEKQKAAAYLMNRGFSWELVQAVVFAEEEDMF